MQKNIHKELRDYINKYPEIDKEVLLRFGELVAKLMMLDHNAVSKFLEPSTESRKNSD